MSKLDDLIRKLCPDGVEYKKLGEIAKEIYRGAGIKRDDITESGIPCVRYGEIYTTYGIWFDRCVSHTDLKLVVSPKYFEYGDILFAVTGESVEDIAKSTVYVGNEECLAGGDIVVVKHNQNPKYLSYALSSTDLRIQKSKGKVKSKVVHASINSIEELIIPLPPLEVQTEIVRILDKYSESVEKLKKALQRELELRQKQYEYFRDKLLTFSIHSRGTVGIEWRTLGEVVLSVNIGINPRKFFKLNPVNPKGFYVTVRELNGLSGVQKCDKTDLINEEAIKIIQSRAKTEIGDILFSNTGTVGKMALVTEPPTNWGVNEGIYIIKPIKEIIISKFLYYYLSGSEAYKQYSSKFTGSTLKHITQIALKSLLIPVPPLSEQERIVKILDKFDKLCNDLKEGLPAEIEKRQKQYEYYRDKLLTFNQKI